MKTTSQSPLQHIAAISWFNPAADHGVWCPSSQTPLVPWVRSSPTLETGGQIAQLVGKPVRYFQRMAPEARHALCAASLALAATQWHAGGEADIQNSKPIGLLNGRLEGTLSSDMTYFQDYLATGRTLARGNLFVYTLPTSASGAVSAVLGLTGPTLYIQDDRRPLHQLLVQAQHIVQSKQAYAMLVLWSDQHAAVCLAVGPELKSDPESAETSSLQAILEGQSHSEPGPADLTRMLSLEVQGS